MRVAVVPSVLAALLAALLVGCSDDPGSEPNPDTATADPDGRVVVRGGGR